jgi:membrane associated rhomboid family serine protease
MYMWFFPIKVKWMVMIYTVGEIFMMFDNAPDDNVGHIAHLGGAVVGFALVYFWNKTNKKRFY